MIFDMNSEKLLDSLIKYASKELVEEMTNEYPNEKNLNGKYSYSSDFTISIEKLISESKQNNKRKKELISEKPYFRL